MGDKTAVKLLQEYGTLENVLENAGNVKGKLGEKLVTFADQARFSKELATIRRDAPVEFSLGACALPDLKQGIPALQKLKLFSLIKRINAGDGESDTPAGGSEKASKMEIGYISKKNMLLSKMAKLYIEELDAYLNNSVK